MKTKIAITFLVLFSLGLMLLIFWFMQRTIIVPSERPILSNPRYLNSELTVCLKQLYGFDVLERQERGEFRPPAGYEEEVVKCMQERIILN